MAGSEPLSPLGSIEVFLRIIKSKLRPSVKAAFPGSDHRDNPMIPELGGHSPEATVAKEALPTPL